ncbi:MAG: tetratricopeptide repeat protein [Alphaproteobacteria bacterium]|nr:tetratricopeptide repeat protein [Alphaproteobacteria bacterium]
MFFQTLWFMIKTSALIAAGAWLATRPGYVDVSYGAYDIHARSGVLLLGGYLALLALLLFYRIYIALSDIPKAWRRYHERKRHVKGMLALSLGLSAVAAGDAKIASYQAYRARQLLREDKGLSVFLEAQAARLRGDGEAARASFQQLVDHRDTAFLGLRGLMLTAMEEGNLEKALQLARDAWRLHPKQPWVLLLVYNLTIRARQWDEAEKILKQVQRIRALDFDKAQSDQVALYLQQSDEAHYRGESQNAIRYAKKAQALAPVFVPAALRLARLYRDEGHRRAAVKVVEACWRTHPHPELVSVWDSLAPERKANDLSSRLRWYERLLALKPDSAESQIAAARVAMEDGLWGEARQYLAMAEKLQPNARLYRLWAKFAERQQQPEESRHWLEKAAEAKPDKVWVCRETGRIYDQWTAVAEPQGGFNTIVWEDPQVLAGVSRPLLSEGTLLLDAPIRVSV